MDHTIIQPDTLEIGDVYLHCGHVDQDALNSFIWIKPADTKITITQDTGKILIAKWVATCDSCYTDNGRNLALLIEGEQLQSYQVFKEDELQLIPVGLQPPIDRINLETELLINLLDLDLSVYKLEHIPLGVGERYLHCGHPISNREWYALEDKIVMPIPVIDKLSIVGLLSSCDKCLFLERNASLEGMFHVENMKLAGDGEIAGLALDLSPPYLKIGINDSDASEVSIPVGTKFISCGHTTDTGYWYHLPMVGISSEGQPTQTAWVSCCNDCVSSCNGNIYLLDYAVEGNVIKKIRLCKLN